MVCCQECWGPRRCRVYCAGRLLDFERFEQNSAVVIPLHVGMGVFDEVPSWLDLEGAEHSILLIDHLDESLPCGPGTV